MALGGDVRHTSSIAPHAEDGPLASPHAQRQFEPEPLVGIVECTAEQLA
jgi:hypothetical protein